MLQRIQLITIFFIGSMSLASGQIVTADPAFPSAGDEVTIFFDATQGTGGLANCNCDVYIHTGVITSESSSSSDWKYVSTEWGQVNADWRLDPVDGQANLYQFTIGPSIRAYYGVPQGEEIQQMAFVFRNADGSLEGKGDGGVDIFYSVFPEDIMLTTAFLSPGSDNFSIALGQEINVSGSASTEASLSLYDNGDLIAQANDATSLEFTIDVVESGVHTVELIAEAGGASDTSRFVYTASLQAVLTSPSSSLFFTSLGANISVAGTSYIDAHLSLYDNDVLVTELDGNTLNHTIPVNDPGAHRIDLVAELDGNTATTSFGFVVPTTPAVMAISDDVNDGITLDPSGTSAIFRLYAPNKSNIYLLGDFNDWLPSNDFQMNKTPDGNTFWVEVTGLVPGEKYAFQYWIDGDFRIADPYSTVVLDPYNDPFIPAETYPDLPAYPMDKTSGIAGLIQPGATEYEWQSNDFESPSKEELVVYELLLRDFIERHDYTTLIDTLDYLEKLGVNAIELLPVNEFEGNISWGYNPSFHMALDKYYGPINEFKRFIDVCHSRGIAVILDVVYNHAFSQSPLARLYWDEGAFQPTAENPWINQVARHPFNVGYDFNHESAATQKFVDQVMTYWLSEFRIDGFRFDLSKGFTQTNNPNDVGAWGNFDQSRIDILRHYANTCWAANPDAYVILEHFANNNEETVLSDDGMMLWGNINHDYNEATMGYSSNLTWGSYQARGWNDPNLVTYMESHDEERLMFKNLEFGNSSGSYNVKDFQTALRRIELGAAFFYTIPGPKMLWQFGELGYEFSINYCQDGTINDNCRVDPKPIRWDYLDNEDRQRLYDRTSAMIHLKTEYEAFNTTDFDLFVSGFQKRIFLFHETMDVAVQGNFNMNITQITNPFPHDGWWYEYFTGDSLLVENAGQPIAFFPGEYRIYTTARLAAPPGGHVTGNYEVVDNAFQLKLVPNPSSGQVTVNYALEESGQVQLEVYNLLGQLLEQQQLGHQTDGLYTYDLKGQLVPGTYVVKLMVDGKIETEQLVVGR